MADGGMADRASATRVIDAPAEAVFGVLTDPASHTAVDGTGWVRETRGQARLTSVGQVFRMPMHHDDHPDGDYETANEVRVFEPPAAIAWATGYDAEDGTLRFGGWTWRYDLAPVGDSSTTVTLTYDWSAVGEDVRAYLSFPPFPPGHLERSLDHLADLVER
jgi:uncharacterized protein YndB with AHSA1/START domain